MLQNNEYFETLSNSFKTINTKKSINTVKEKQYLTTKDDVSKAINAYLNDKVGKYGQYFALPNALVHRRVTNDYNKGKATMHQSVLAMDINGVKIGNSSVLPMLGAKIAWGNLNENREVTPAQTSLSQFITMVPFTVFDEANLDVRKLNVIDKGKEETFTIKVRNPKYTYDNEDMKKKGIKEFIEETRHFTGACLFEVEGRYFLFDVDREEIKHKLFNAFLAEAPNAVKSIAEAYASLKPLEVLEAEKSGLKVVRQGEWFFVPVKGEYEPDQDTVRWGDKTGQLSNKRIELRAGANRPNTADMGVEKLQLVKGKVTHSGREHRDIVLTVWHKAIPNTATRSFTITGNVD